MVIIDLQAIFGRVQNRFNGNRHGGCFQCGRPTFYGQDLGSWSKKKANSHSGKEEGNQLMTDGVDKMYNLIQDDETCFLSGHVVFHVLHWYILCVCGNCDRCQFKNKDEIIEIFLVIVMHLLSLVSFFIFVCLLSVLTEGISFGVDSTLDREQEWDVPCQGSCRNAQLKASEGNQSYIMFQVSQPRRYKF